MQIFLPELNFDSLLRAVASYGGVFVEQAFTDEYLAYLLEEVEHLDYGEYNSSDNDSVYEKHRDFRARVYQTDASIPRLTELVEYIGWCMRIPNIRGVNNHLFYPDDVNVWRYSDKSCAIGKHRDYSHDLYLIAGITLTGYCTLEYWGEDKDNTKPKLWQAGPGSLMLLRGPGLCTNDTRPYHAVNAPLHGERISIVVRQDIRNSQPDDTSKEY